MKVFFRTQNCIGTVQGWIWKLAVHYVKERLYVINMNIFAYITDWCYKPECNIKGCCIKSEGGVLHVLPRRRTAQVWTSRTLGTCHGNLFNISSPREESNIRTLSHPPHPHGPFLLLRFVRTMAGSLHPHPHDYLMRPYCSNKFRACTYGRIKLPSKLTGKNTYVCMLYIHIQHTYIHTYMWHVCIYNISYHFMSLFSFNFSTLWKLS